MKNIYIGIIFMHLVACISAQSDVIRDKELIKDYYIKQNTSHAPTNIKYKLNIINAPLIFYKKILSDQISANCEYQPSCSTFSYLAIDEFGILKGLFLTADRLTRCNGNSLPETLPYLIRNEDFKIIDFPGQYRFGK